MEWWWKAGISKMKIENKPIIYFSEKNRVDLPIISPILTTVIISFGIWGKQWNFRFTGYSEFFIVYEDAEVS